MAQRIPLRAVPAQVLTISLANQPCKIHVHQKQTGLYCDLYVNNVLIIGGVRCHNLNKIVRSEYLGFVGDLCFMDNEGSDDPFYTGLNSRWTFVYLEVSDLPPA